MKSFFIFVLALTLSACSLFQNASGAVTGQSAARGAVSVLEDAWIGAAKTCLATNNQATITKCEAVLDPARDALLAAANSVDAWSSVDHGQFGCALAEVTSAIESAYAASGAPVPALVKDAEALVAPFAAACTDAGK